MRPLPKERVYHGYQYQRLLRGKYAALYRQVVSPTVCYYEVFLVYQRPEKQINGQILEAAEKWPKDEVFGYSGWVYKSYKEAKKRFDELEAGIARQDWESTRKEDA